MNELTSVNDYGIFCDKRDMARADSRMVAQMFGKDHKKVLRDIRELDCSAEFNVSNFGPIFYKDEYGRKQPAYAMTRDGFMFLVMGYRGKKAAAFKEAYIRRFNEMENTIRAMVNAREQFPRLTEQIKLMHDNPKPYHFSNECNMLNCIVLGMTAKQYRIAHGIEKAGSIRPCLTEREIAALDTLQTIDIGLLVSTPDYQQRKQLLEWYAVKRLAA